MGAEDWFPSDDPAAAPDKAQSTGGRPPIDYAGRGNRRLQCPACGFHVRTSGAQIESLPDLPACGCGERMILPLFRDRFAIDPDGTQREVMDRAFRAARDRHESQRDAEESARVAFNDELRAAKLARYIVPAPDRVRRGGTKVCDYPGCRLYTAAMYCKQHENERPELSRARRSL